MDAGNTLESVHYTMAGWQTPILVQVSVRNQSVSLSVERILVSLTTQKMLHAHVFVLIPGMRYGAALGCT